MPTFSFLRSRLAQLLAVAPREPAADARAAVGRKRGFRPSVRRLEPRLVLNASAELTSLGQLVITGSDAADYVRLDVDSLGQITLQDAFGDRIDIVGNPSGQAEPLNSTEVFSNQIRIDLLDGDDTLDLAIPSGLNVTVVDGGGFDTINVIRPDSPQPNESATHQLGAQAIRFDAGVQPLDWRNQNFQLTGNVFVGVPFSPTRTDILIDGGSWQVDGRLILQSDVGFLANTNGGSIDLPNATLTADRTATTLTVDLGNADTAVLRIGSVDDSGSHSIANLSVESANRVDLQSANFRLPGELSIQNVSDTINIDSQISASNISLQASSIRLVDSSITATTGDIQIDGPVTLIGDLDVRTTDSDVTFTDTIDGNHRLFIDAGAGGVALQNDLGQTDALSQVEISADRITLQSLTTRAGDISLVANTIDFTGQTISTLDSGDLSINGDLIITTSNGNLTSAGTAKISGMIRGNVGTENLTITANDRIELDANTQQIGSLSLLANNSIQTLGTINVNQDFTATSAAVIISGDITLLPGSGGLLTLDGKDLVRVDNGTILSIANGMLAIDTEGTVDLADSIVDSDSPDADVLVRGATSVTLGDIRLENGLIDLQTISIPSATIGQSVGTSIVATRLKIAAGGNVVLLNSGNAFEILEEIHTQGDFRVRDDVGDLTIRSAVISGATVDIFTASTLYLNENAIIAEQADVRLQAGQSIINSGVDASQINVSGKTLNATAGTGIGGADPLRTAIDRLIANVLFAGSINIVENDSIELQQVSTDDGPISVTASGSITAVDVVSHNRSRLDGPYDSLESRDIKLIANGMTSDIRVVQITANHAADVLLIAGDDVVGTSNGIMAEVIADDLEVIAGNAADDGILAISLITDINDLLFSVNGTGRGDVEIRDLNSLALASSDSESDADQLRTNNGEIRIIAGDSIVLIDLDPQNDLQRPLADPEIIAGGDNGRITLIARNKIELGNQTQIVAAQSTAGAVRLESDEVVFGETIEINTGSGVGIAKHFLPRPAIEETETAFYDETTIRTDVLTQENSNDAKGFLTLRVGLPGERGLQVDIDWGAPTNRFQRIINVSADNSRLVDGKLDIIGPITDDPLLRVSHIYLESDILDSMLNDRTSATSPLNVRFAVSHHESIIVQAGNVTQGFDESGEPLSAEVAGRLVSSTDNPLTAGVFESGTARFIIPNLTIPVAFFPVRNIIPEPIKLESFARPVESILLSTGSVESESGSASSSATRDEYLQIRILSPDPTGEDLADPKRLPDDILSGDKLQRLFENLPDGRYEIGYVFGDGNVRSLLMVDNRDGETKFLGQEIKGGPLRLQRLSPAELDVQPMTDNAPGSDMSVEPNTSPPAIEPNDDVQVEEEKSPNLEDQGFRPTTNSFESAATATIAGGFLVDATVNRFSIVGRYLSRRQKNHCSSRDHV